MTMRFAVVHEAEADFRTATRLADLALVDSIEWLEEEMLADQREWIAKEAKGRRITWKSMKMLAGEAGIKSHGHFDGAAGLADAAAARRAIDYLLVQFPQLDAILLIRDRDDQPDRQVGLEQARNQDRSGTPVVIGLAIVERESWLICGFKPQDTDEQSRLDAERSTLGFDPRLHSHELTACKDDSAKRSPKRVWKQLSGGDHDRERLCWTGCPLSLLQERGRENGLANYLQEVRDRLAPLIGHVTQGRQP